MKTWIAAGLAMCVPVHVTAATLDIVAAEQGPTVVFTGTGSIDLGGLLLFQTDYSTPANNSHSTAPSPFVIGGASEYDLYSGFTGYTPLATTAFGFASTGDGFGIEGSLIAVGAGYTSLDDIAFTWTVDAASFSSLGLTFGTIAQFGNNTITLSEDTSALPLPPAVPLPPALLLLTGALGGLVMRRAIAIA